jgi:transposase
VAKRKRRVYRFPDEFRRPAVERVDNGEPLVAVARDIDVHPQVLRHWVDESRRAEEGEPVKPPLTKDLDGLRRENQQLKQALAEKTLELDFFRGALQKVEARRQPHGGAGETASTPKSGK